MSDTLQTNLERATQYLKRFQEKPLAHYINGEFTDGTGGHVVDNATPVDNSVLCQLREGSVEDTDRACEAAAAAFEGWATTPGSVRKKLLNKFADRLEERADEIALLESMDSGQCIRYMKQAALRGADNFRFFADKAPEAQNGQALHQKDHINYTVRKAIGPVGVITPWNTPFMLSTWKIAPALAAGCTIVHKPAELTPVTAHILAEIADEVLPKGVWNMVNGRGGVVGKRLSEHPAIKAVALVGESATGSLLMKQGADTLKRLHLELGGKNPMIVFDDADYDRALDATVFMLYSLNGQRCTSSSRLLIQNGIKAKFVADLEKRVAALKVGHPLDPISEVGPLVHTGHFNKVCSYFDIAKQDGAKIAVGGVAHTQDTGTITASGNYIVPTLFTEATNSMRISQEEIFGPVLTVIGFDTEEEAIHIANDVDYGLSGYVWTENTSCAMRMGKYVETGMLWVNSENVRNLPSPFGGIKRSGIGRDGGDWSFEFYMETKNVCIALGTHKVPRIGVPD